MINRIVDAALGNRMVVLILIAALVAAGLLSMQRLPFDADPDISPLQVLVTTQAPGLAPPDVERSKLESRDGDHFRVFLRFRRHKVITVVLSTEHEVQYFRDARGKAHSRSSAVRIAQVENAGKRDEREKTPGDDDGFLWRMETWWRMEERDGGVYVQSEVASLTRDIPTGLGWLIAPFVTSIPKDSLTFTLGATRSAVVERKTPKE